MPVENKLKQMRRIKRSVRLFKQLEYSTGAWWLIGQNGWQRAILYDRSYKLLTAGKLRIFIERIKVAWTLAYWYLLNDDGLYSILEEKKDGYVLYKY